MHVRAFFDSVLFENPLLRRQLATALVPPRFALVFAFYTLVLIVTNATFFWIGFVESSGLAEELPAGQFVLTANCVLIYYLFSLLLPLRVAGVLEGPRRDGVLDQLVVTGISPARLIAGSWLLGWFYALVLLVVALPFISFAMMLGDVSVGSVALAFGVLALYAHVILGVTLALSTVEREWVTVPLSIALFVVLGMMSGLPVSELAEISPLRALLRATGASVAMESTTAGAALGASDPVLFYSAVPATAYSLGLWGAILLGCVLRIAIGPYHAFARGVNNFGHVVLPGDRKRRWRRRLRMALSRRVDLRFFWENRPAWCDRVDGLLRLVGPLLVLTVLWAIVVGLFYRGSPQIDNLRFMRDERAVLSTVVIALVAAIGIVLRGDTRGTLGRRESILGLSVPRPAVTAVIGLALVAASFAIDFDLHERVLSAGRTQGLTETPATGTTYAAFEASSRAFSIGVALQLLSVFLAAQVLSHLCAAKAVWFVGLVVFVLAEIFLPPLVLEGIVGGVVPLGWAPVVFCSPIALIIADSSWVRSDVLVPAGISDDDTFALLIRGQVAIACALGALLALCWVARGWLARRRARRAATASAKIVAPALLAFVLVGSGTAVAQEEARRASISIVDVRVGFTGFTLDSAPYFYRITLRNDLAEPVAGRLIIGAGARSHARDVELAPGTTRVIHWMPLSAGGIVWQPLLSGEDELRFESPGHPPSVYDMPVAGTVVGDRAGSRSGGQGVFLLVSADASPPNRGRWSRHEWLRARPEELPEDQRAYVGVSGIILQEVELAALRGAQRRSLYDYLRLGGVVLLSGRVAPHLVSGADEWEGLLANRAGEVEVTRSVVRDGVALEVLDLPESEVHWWLPGGDGRAAVPVVRSRPVGAGRFGHVVIDLAAREFPAETPEAFWQELSGALPRGCYPLLFTAGAVSGTDELLDLGPLLVVLAYYVIYALALTVPLFFVFRRKGRRASAAVFTVLVVVVFCLALPLGRSFFLGRPSYASLATVTCYGSGARRGVTYSVLRLRSSGRQEHRSTLRGSALSRLDIDESRRAWMWGWQWETWRIFSPRSSGPGWPPGGADAAIDDVHMLRPWATRQSLFVGDVTRESPHVGRALYDPRTNSLQFHVAGVEAIPPGSGAFLLLCDAPSFPGAVTITAPGRDAKTFLGDGGLSGELDLAKVVPSRGVGQRGASIHGLSAIFPAEGDMRVFVGWEVPSRRDAFAVESDALRFEKEVPTERSEDGEPILSRRQRDPWRFVVRGGTLYRRLERSIVLLELDVEVKRGLR